MNLPLVYIALDERLIQELELDSELERLHGLALVERWAGPGQISAAALADAVGRAEVLLTGWGTPALDRLAEWSPERFVLRLLVHTAGTVKHLLPPSAIERGLLVTHANESLAEAVAEFTLGAILTERRRAFAAAQRLREGRPPLPLATMHEVSGSTVGVIGASAIGRRVMQLLAPLNVTLLLYDPYCSAEDAATYGATLLGLHELLQRSDVVTLHAPVTPETLGMLGSAEFAAMRDGALFVNTARGRLIDAEALLRELQSGRINALLDVTDPTEPLPPDSPFFALENCVVLPHLAGISVQARLRQGRIAVDETLRYLHGAPLRYPITRERWDTMA